jgi:hypothetical protein
MVLLSEGVVEVRCEPSLISFTTRGRKELLAIGLKLQHHGLGVLAGSDVDIHDLERQFINTAIVRSSARRSWPAPQALGVHPVRRNPPVFQ